MKKTLLILFICVCSLSEAATICLNMIVKNETKVIRRCLDSVKPLIDTWVIVDTGSTDGTQSLIKDVMKGIPGELHERPWVDFAHNRNEALQLAKGKADYILFIDADDVLAYDIDFKKPKDLMKDFYNMKIAYSGTSYSRAQLVKSLLDWKWVGVVHEVVMSSQAKTSGDLPGVTMVIIGGGDRSQEEQTIKFLRDAVLLEKALASEPNHTRNTFYLAQSYRDAGIPEMALKKYQKRVELGGWPEEVFWSMYQVGLLQEELKAAEDVVVKSYSDAYQYRPSRIEPLYRLSGYYRRKDNFLMGYLVSKLGLEVKSSSDLLFVESWMYDYGLLFEYSICAYWVGKYEESLHACEELLKNPKLPAHIRDQTQKNLSFAKERLFSETTKKAG